MVANPATPVQADELLVDDVDEDVRGNLALKIARLLPDMPYDEQERVKELTFEMLRRLASDLLPRVRVLLAEELKNNRHVPVSIVQGGGSEKWPFERDREPDAEYLETKKGHGPDLESRFLHANGHAAITAHCPRPAPGYPGCPKRHRLPHDRG